MPQETIDFFPRLRAAVDHAEIAAPSTEAASPVKQAEEAVEEAAGKAAGREKGQGFEVDQRIKVAVEAHAMNVAAEFYSKEWDVEDVHGKESYDLVCRRRDEVKHIEVKGTKTDGAEVILTRKEVQHAEDYPSCALFVLSNQSGSGRKRNSHSHRRNPPSLRSMEHPRGHFDAHRILLSGSVYRQPVVLVGRDRGGHGPSTLSLGQCEDHPRVGARRCRIDLSGLRAGEKRIRPPVRPHDLRELGLG